MRKQLEKLLNLLAKITIWKYRPVIVAITGSVGKTTSKNAVSSVLARNFKIRSSGGNLNNELGVPMTILGDWADEYYKKGSSKIIWLKIVLSGIWGIIWPRRYPKILVLEYGADKPGDIKKLAKTFPPNIGVITAVGETPVHVEYYASPKAVAEEKYQLIKKMKFSDCAILNFDDLTVLEMKEKTSAHTLTFGFGEGADVKISNFDISFGSESMPDGVSFKIHYDGSFVPVKINGSLGRSQAMAAAAATAVALKMGMHLIEVSEALSNYEGPAGRLKILKGIKDTMILDDTYNASPSAMHVAIEALRDFPAKRKVAVLGDMLELGKFTIDAHRTLGDLAGGNVDLLICIGEKAKFIADSASGEIPKGAVKTYENSDVAKGEIQKLIEPGDVVLVKGSQGMRMEKIVQEIMAEPDKKQELLVRQSISWLNK